MIHTRPLSTSIGVPLRPHNRMATERSSFAQPLHHPTSSTSPISAILSLTSTIRRHPIQPHRPSSALLKSLSLPLLQPPHPYFPTPAPGAPSTPLKSLTQDTSAPLPFQVEDRAAEHKTSSPRSSGALSRARARYPLHFIHL